MSSAASMSFGIFCPLLGFSGGNRELDAVFGEDLVRFYSLRDHSSDGVSADALTGEVSVRYVYHQLERLGWAMFSWPQTPEFDTMQKEDFPSHQTCGICMEY